MVDNSQKGYQPTFWTSAHVARIVMLPIPEVPLISASDVVPVIVGFDVWDAWPLTDADGRIVKFADAELWMMLSAPMMHDPIKRHDVARIRLFEKRGPIWDDCGNLLPDGLCPGTREWTSSAIYEPTAQTITLYLTAAGRKGEAFSFEQRQFATTGKLHWHENRPAVKNWTTPELLYSADTGIYIDTRNTEGGPAIIKAFRDPFYFRDPADRAEYITFAGSDGQSTNSFNGVIGIARREGRQWKLLPPILSADGLCNELERPHIIKKHGHYYLFWCTQRHVFAEGGPSGPNGLYGAIADNIFGPYRLLNETGLVAATPTNEPFQTFAWLVLDTLEVTSFIDYWGMDGRTFETFPDLKRKQFGGSQAPFFRIEFDGATTHLVG